MKRGKGELPVREEGRMDENREEEISRARWSVGCPSAVAAAAT